MSESLVHLNTIPHHILHILFEKVWIILQDLLAFLIDKIKKIIEMKPNAISGTIPPLLYYRPPIFQPPFCNLQTINKFPSF